MFEIVLNDLSKRREYFKKRNEDLMGGSNKNNNIDKDYYLKTENNCFRKGKRSFRNLQNNGNMRCPGITDQFKSHFILG